MIGIDFVTVDQVAVLVVVEGISRQNLVLLDEKIANLLSN